MKHLPKAPLPSLFRATATLALAAVLAPAVPAQGDGELIGIYTANDGSRVSEMTLAPGFSNMATAYVCLTGITDPAGISGWELTLSGTDVADGVVVTSWDMTWGAFNPTGPLNIGSPPEFIVGVPVGPGSNPIAHSPEICVLSFDFFVMDSAPKAFYIHPTSVPSIAGYTAYVGGTDAGNLRALDWAYGGEPYVAFTVNSAGSCTPRDGVMGLNPGGYECTTAPFAGTPWATTIDPTPLPGNNTLSTLQIAGLSGAINNVPLLGYEMLCLPPYYLDAGQGTHSMFVPAGTTGLNVSTQGARVELDPLGNIVVVLMNAVDVVIGG